MNTNTLEIEDIRKLIPPNSKASEQAVLGSIIFEPSTMCDVMELLGEDDFYASSHVLIFRAMRALFQAGETLDIISISEYLYDNAQLDQAGGRTYLMDLAMSVATAQAARYHADKVKNYALRRRIIRFGMELQDVASESRSAEDVLEMAQAGILSIAQAADRKTDATPASLAKEAFQNVHYRLHNPNRIVGVKTGFGKLDRFLGGLQAGRLVILGARPSMGKSGLALNIAQHVAKAENKPVLFYSLEMEPVKLVERALVATAESQSALEKLQIAADEFPDKLRIIDRPSLSIASLRASMLKNRLELGELGLVIIDYLQLMKGMGGNRNEEVSSISRGLKLLAREFKIPVLALAQLSRDVEKRQDKRPMNSDLRDSGAVEQDADTVIFLYRDEYYNPDSDRPGIAEVIISKNRDGSVGRFELLFRKDIVKFIEPGFRS